MNSQKKVTRLVEDNMRLARFFGRQFAPHWGENDALSIAMDGLLKAAQDWDGRIPFGSFGSMRIRWAFSREYHRERRVKRGGGTAIHVSLDAPLDSGEADGRTVADLIADPLAGEQDLAARRNDELDRLPSLLARLKPRHRRIVRERFGFDGDPMTLEAIAAGLGITRERVRQLEVEAIGALNQLRRASEVLELREGRTQNRYLRRHRGAAGRAILRNGETDASPQTVFERLRLKRVQAHEFFAAGATDAETARAVAAAPQTVAKWRRELEGVRGPFARRWRRRAA